MYRYGQRIHSPEVSTTWQPPTPREENELAYTIGSLFLAAGSGGIAETPRAHFYDRADATYIPETPSAIGYTALAYEVELSAGPTADEILHEFEHDFSHPSRVIG